MSKYDYSHPSDQIVEFMQRIYDYGMTTTSGGNLSIIDSDKNMWISPSGVDKGTLRRDNIMCVKADGEIVGRHRPSVEYPFHRDVYKLRSDVGAILHAHPPALVSFSVAGKIPNTMVHPDAYEVCGKVGFAVYDVPGSDELGKKVSAPFKEGSNTVIMENHGTCVCADSMEEAFQRFETLDFTARLLNNAIRLGTPHYLTAEQINDALTDRNTEFIPATISGKTSEEKEMRLLMSQLIRRSYKQQLFTSTSGTYAMRLSDGKFLVSPSKMDRATIVPEDLVLIDGFKYEAGKIPSRATWFIKAILDAQPEINAVVIALPPHLMAYGVANVEFNPRVIPESYIVLREVPTFEFGTQFSDLKAITSVLSPRYPVVRIKNDCVITTGKAPLEAFDRLEVAEYSAKATIDAAALGGMNPINDEQVADLVKAFKLIP